MLSKKVVNGMIMWAKIGFWGNNTLRLNRFNYPDQ